MSSSFMRAMGRPSPSRAARPYTSQVEKWTSQRPRSVQRRTSGTRSV